MTNETIAVYFEPLGNIAGEDYYHETIIYTYTDSNGKVQQRYLTSGPTKEVVFSGLSDELSKISSARSDVESNTPSVWGTLFTEEGALTPLSAVGKTQDRFGNAYQFIVVASGSNLKAQWDQMVAEEAKLANEDLTYSPTTQNSNSMASTALLAVGIQPPDADISSSHYAPASGNILDPLLESAYLDRIPQWLSSVMEPILDALVSNADGEEIPTATTNSGNSVTTQYSDGYTSTKVINPSDDSYTVSTVSSNDSTSVVNYMANGGLSSAITNTVNGDGTYTISNTNDNDTATSTTYNASDNMVVNAIVINADGSSSDVTYDANGNILSKTIEGADGSYSNTTYYANGNISGTDTINADDSWSNVGYYANGNISFYSQDINENESGAQYTEDGTLIFSSYLNSDYSTSYTYTDLYGNNRYVSSVKQWDSNVN